MPLRPLHFVRAGTRVRYGTSTYITDCGRFELFKTTMASDTVPVNMWGIAECEDHVHEYQWQQWLYSHFIDFEYFPTLKEALAGLEHMLASDSLVDADKP